MFPRGQFTWSIQWSIHEINDFIYKTYLFRKAYSPASENYIEEWTFLLNIIYTIKLKMQTTDNRSIASRPAVTPNDIGEN